MSARKKTETLDVTNWMSFIHHMLGAALHMGPSNFTSIQLALQFWDYYAETNYLKDQKHIIYFAIGAFRCNNKYTYRGGITHFSQKGQEKAEYLMMSALKIEKASYGEQSQPPITTPIPLAKIELDSWENRLAELAVDMVLHPDKEEYKKGYLLNPEKMDASPLAHMTLKIYLQILQRAINYEKKRKVIGKLSELKGELKEYISELRKEVQGWFDETKEEYMFYKTQTLGFQEEAKKFRNDISSMLKDCNQEINETKAKFNVLLEVKEETERIEDKLGKKIGKHRLSKILEQNLNNLQTASPNLTVDVTKKVSADFIQENLTNLLTSTLPFKRKLERHFQFMLICLECHPQPIRQSTAYKRLGEDRNYFQDTIPELISVGLIIRQNKYYFNIPTKIVRKLSEGVRNFLTTSLEGISLEDKFLTTAEAHSNVSNDVKQLSKNEEI